MSKAHEIEWKVESEQNGLCTLRGKDKKGNEFHGIGQYHRDDIFEIIDFNCIKLAE